MGKYTGHQQAADFLAEKWSKNPDRLGKLGLAYRMTRDTECQAQVDVFGQPYSGWTMGQLWALYTLNSLSNHDYFTVAQFEIGVNPRGDKKRAENQAALANLPDGIRAIVHPRQRGGDKDGMLYWDQPLENVNSSESSARQIQVDTLLGAPLEIGHTDASCTCLHLGLRGAVARWPYGHPIITLIVLEPRTLIQEWRFGRETEDLIEAGLTAFCDQAAMYRMTGKLLRV